MQKVNTKAKLRHLEQNLSLGPISSVSLRTLETSRVFIVNRYDAIEDRCFGSNLLQRLRNNGIICSGKEDFILGGYYLKQFFQHLDGADSAVIIYSKSFKESEQCHREMQYLDIAYKLLIFLAEDDVAVPNCLSNYVTVSLDNSNWFEKLLDVLGNKKNAPSVSNVWLLYEIIKQWTFYLFDTIIKRPLSGGLNFIYSQCGKQYITTVCFRVCGIIVDENSVQINLKIFSQYKALILSLVSCFNHNIVKPRDSISVVLDNKFEFPLTSSASLVEAFKMLVKVFLKGPSLKQIDKIGKEWHVACTKEAANMVPTETEMNCRSAVFNSLTEQLSQTNIHKDYETLQSRINSFRKCQPDKFQSISEMAEAGFFYDELCNSDRGTSDCVRCFACSIAICNWRPCQEPWARHARRFPNCPHVKANKNCKFIDESRKNTPCVKDTYNEKYHNFVDRLDSFGVCFTGSALSKDEMADAGFYFIGMNDVIACYKCGVCLGCRSFDIDDNMWDIHAVFSPDCCFVKEVKGSDFIRNVNKHRLMSIQDHDRRILTFFVNFTSTLNSKTHRYVHVL